MNNSKFNIFINKKTVSIFDRGFNYGDGLFETILVKDLSPLYLKEHLQRLHKGCVKLKIQKPSLLTIKNNIKKCIGKSNNCIIKIILTRGIGSLGYEFINSIKPNLYFIKIKNNVKDSDLTSSVNLGIAKYEIKENTYLSKIKHINRIDQALIASELNKAKNINDLLVINKGLIIETLASNIFFVKKIKNNLTFYTPKLDNYGIDGVMRNVIINYLKKKKYKIYVVEIPLTKIKFYNYCFKVNTIKGLVFIDSIQKKKFPKADMLYNIFNNFIYTQK
tara:strand:+ start:1496 stop:2326 length:831 start_codon:yes stop_codon:yes gene_type:complete